MTKKEFLAFSLPYKLIFRIEYGSTNQPTGIYKMSGVYETSVVEGFNYDNNVKTDKLKPILRPLSDLIKQIEHEGEKFVPIEKLRNTSGIYDTNLGVQIYLDELRTESFLKLIEWHFDVAGLIEKGEAIDVNYLETNPYK